MINVIALMIILALVALFIAYIRHSNKVAWNDGICRCGGRWRFFGLTKAGSRIYHCQYCDNEIIITDVDY
jgi:hypothetical protein